MSEAIYDDEGREVARGWSIRTERLDLRPPPPDHPAWDSALLFPAPSPLLVARDLDDALRQAHR